MKVWPLHSLALAPIPPPPSFPGLAEFVSSVFGAGGGAVVTPGFSRTLTSFLRVANERTKGALDIYLTEGGARKPGNAAAAALTAAPAHGKPSKFPIVKVNVLPDESAWSFFSAGGSRLLLLPAVAVARDGSAVCEAGAAALVVAARAHGATVCVIASAVKLNPLPSATMIVDAVREKSNAAISAPENALSYEAAVEMGIAGNASEEQLALVAPRWDCIAPEAIDAIYTNAGAVSPMGVWRLVEETY